jgi:predicted dehydrogenase
VMFMHHPRLERIRRVLDDGTSIGQVKRITSSFSFHLAEKAYDTNVRVNSRLEPAGCLGDLGWYCIRFTLWAMGWRMPREVTGRILAQRGGAGSRQVPADFSAELIFDDDTSAGFYCSFIAEYQHWAHISGDRGQLRVADFVHPEGGLETNFEVNGSLVRVKSGGGRRVKAAAVAQPTRMIRNFVQQVFSGKLNREWPESALKTQRVMDACLEAARKGSKIKLRA